MIVESPVEPADEPWLVELDSGLPCGAKAGALGGLRAAGFDVPNGFVVTAAGLGQPGLDTLLAARIAASDCDRWAVRSSGESEDTADLSYAGQYRTLLGVPSAAVPAAVTECWRSSTGEEVLRYRAGHGRPAAPGTFHVLVQEMVPAEVSGVAFSVNPLTGADTEVVVEAAAGLGEDVVSGRTEVERFVHEWYAPTPPTPTRSAPGGPTGSRVLSRAERTAVVDLALAVQRHVGHPVDIEWAIADGRVRLLQSRPITRIQFAGVADQWTTANFRDGGVAATVCTPLMASLYFHIWDRWMPRYLIESKLLRPEQIGQPGRVFFGRPYWNLSTVKAAMAAAPGYRERQFDTELGLRSTYAGDGHTTPLTPRTLARAAHVAVRQRQLVAAQRDTVRHVRDELLRTYAAYEDWLNAPATPDEIERTWHRLVFTDHDRATGTYFWQIFINTLQLALTKRAMVRLVGEQGFFRLISGLADVSHLRPFAAAWHLSRAIRTDPLDRAYWTERSVEQITADLAGGSSAHCLDGVRDLIARFGYHSTHELEVAHPDFDTDHAAVVAMVRDAVTLADECAPALHQARLHSEYAAELSRAGRKAGRLRTRALRRRIKQNRGMLWWREELKDVSTRFFHLIRRTTLRLAEELVRSGTLARAEDVWFCRIDDLTAHLDGQRSAEQLRAIIDRNRAYYESFRNFDPPPEIGARSQDSAADSVATRPAATQSIAGVGASAGIIEATARVIADLTELDRLRPGDILVTKFTDTGWTGKFALLGGIVLEHGGVLAHAAVVAREYGIPAVVTCPGARALIPDGARIRIDGVSGAVEVLR